MGLDLVLIVLILLAGLKGWSRGFLLQVVQLGGLIGGVYLAEPVRELARPHVAPYFPALSVSLFDRFLWWGSAFLAYLAIVCAGSILVRISRSGPFREAERNRVDQVFGLGIGLAKGVLVASVLTLLIDRYGLQVAKDVKWVDAQVAASRALVLNRQYTPAAKVWDSPPVQKFVAYVQRMGIRSPEGEVEGTAESESATAQSPEGGETDTETQPIPAGRDSAVSLKEIEATVQALRATLDDSRKPR